MVVILVSYLKSGIDVINKIKENGFEAYFVGGFVRDYLLGLDYNDIDIATSALPKELKNIFETVDTGIKFNSVKIKYNGFEFETTTFRQDLAYNDHRHPVYQKADSILIDLKRRDFTINAMAMNEKMEVIDLYDGQKDLENKVIRTVLEPTKRFNEDALRMLRAAYFAAKLDFEIEKKTLSGMKQCGYLVQDLSNDRILWEFEKIINAKYTAKGFKALVDSNIINYLPLYKEVILMIVEKNINDLSFEDFLTLAFYHHQNELDNYQIKNVYKTHMLKVYEVIKIKNIDTYEMFKNGLHIILSVDLINVIFNNKKSNKDKYIKLDSELVIRSVSELNVKAKDIINLIELTDLKQVNQIIEELIKLVLNKKLANTETDIFKYLLKKYQH